MHITRILFVGSCVAGLAAACGGSKTTGGDTDDGGGLNSSSGASSGGSGSGSSSGSSGGDDAATLFDTGIPGLMQSCASSQDCTGGEVCCTSFGMQSATIACAATCGMGSFQLCASSDECTGGATCVALPVGMAMICQPPRGDGGMFMRRDGGGRPMDDGGRPAEDGGTPADTGAE